MIRIAKGTGSAALAKILGRGNLRFEKQEKAVAAIIAALCEEGDQALFRLTKKFDRTVINGRTVRLPFPGLKARAMLCEPRIRVAINAAIRNIKRYHLLQRQAGFSAHMGDGVVLGQRVLPVDSVAIYIPAGSAPLFSTVLMTVIPAQIAGVRRILVATPPVSGGLDPAIAYALMALRVTEVYRIGGAQAIAAFAFGTCSIPKVDKIVGPGNISVSLAKKQLYGIVDIDMIAGPSEVCVIADAGAPAAYVARDLLSQAEHGTGLESSVLLTPSMKLAKAVQKEINTLASGNPVITRVLNNYGLICVLKDIAECCAVANTIAPEHLELMVKQPEIALKQIRHAGAIFLGYATCESIGDYFAGPSHVLPTNGTARFYSPLGVYNFVKRQSVIKYSDRALKKSGSKIIAMAEKEGMQYHAESVRVRMG